MSASESDNETDARYGSMEDASTLYSKPQRRPATRTLSMVSLSGFFSQSSIPRGPDAFLVATVGRLSHDPQAAQPVPEPGARSRLAIPPHVCW